jgi:plasmid maintenance system antidote protein VapI
MKKDNSIFNIHIGSIIKEKAAEKGFSEKRLAELIDCHPSNISHLFNRESINTEQLMKISIALEYNFFKEVYVKYFSSALKDVQCKKNR